MAPLSKPCIAGAGRARLPCRRLEGDRGAARFIEEDRVANCLRRMITYGCLKASSKARGQGRAPG